MTIRQIIHAELTKCGWSRYRLVQEVKDNIPERTVYAFLSGQCDISSDAASILLEALNLEIVKKSKRDRKET